MAAARKKTSAGKKVSATSVQRKATTVKKRRAGRDSSAATEPESKRRAGRKKPATLWDAEKSRARAGVKKAATPKVRLARAGAKKAATPKRSARAGAKKTAKHGVTRARAGAKKAATSRPNRSRAKKTVRAGAKKTAKKVQRVITARAGAKKTAKTPQTRVGVKKATTRPDSSAGAKKPATTVTTLKASAGAEKPATKKRAAKKSATRTSSTIRARVGVKKTATRRQAVGFVALTEAVSLLGSKQALAKAMGVSPRVLAGYFERGLPPAARSALAEAVRIAKAAGRERQWVGREVRDRLREVIKRAGGAVPAARAFLVSPATLNKWLVAGPPTERFLQIEQLRTRLRKEVTTAKEDRETFKALLGEAFVTQIPVYDRHGRDTGKTRSLFRKYRTRTYRRVGPRTYGYSWCWAINRELSLQLIDTLMGHLETARLSARAGFALWQTVAIVTEFQPDTSAAMRGSKPQNIRVYQLQSPRSGDFGLEATFGGAVYQRFQTAAGELRAELEKLLEEGLYGFVHAVFAHNFNRRTGDQKRQFETKQRYSRTRQERLKKKRQSRAN